MGSGTWKAKGPITRPWHETRRREGLTGVALDKWLVKLAGKYPGNVVVQ